MDESDAAAVARACAGETEAVRVLVERYRRKVFRLAYRMTRNEQDAEDVVQDTFLRAYRRLKQFESRSSFGTWIFRIAVNSALDLTRKLGRYEQAEQPMAGPEGGAVTLSQLPAPEPAAEGEDEEPGEDGRLSSSALTAIAFHADASAERGLEDFVAPGQPERQDPRALAFFEQLLSHQVETPGTRGGAFLLIYE